MPGQGGTAYSNPHMEKGKCWIADGFDFNGYDAIYIAPTVSTAKFPDKPEDKKVHELAKQSLVTELARMVNTRQLFNKVVTQESDIKPGSKALKLENTITEFSKGGGAGRYFGGLYGAGQPVLRVQGKMSDGGKPVFTYEIRRSGTSAGARMNGVFMKDEDIQLISWRRWGKSTSQKTKRRGRFIRCGKTQKCDALPRRRYELSSIPQGDLPDDHRIGRETPTLPKAAGGDKSFERNRDQERRGEHGTRHEIDGLNFQLGDRVIETGDEQPHLAAQFFCRAVSPFPGDDALVTLLPGLIPPVLDVPAEHDWQIMGFP